MINVTKSTLPPLDEYVEYLKGIWERNHLTNSGPLALELEEKLQAYLQAPHFYYVSNGTVALQIAIKALGLTGEIITTPFSYVATTTSILWQNCTPIFVDIDEKTLTIDPEKIISAITEKTQAILATHVYGNPCAVNEIEKIAKKYQLKVIYDAAHSFGVAYEGRPIANYGDISALSFHATKLFSTAEGGGLVCQDPELAHKLAYLRNFGHANAEEFFDIGINGKNSEFHAAMGLCNLPTVAASILKRRDISVLYDNLLLQNQFVRRPQIRPGTTYNFSYYPVIFRSEADLLNVVSRLQSHGIKPRRYFYPALSTLHYVKSTSMPIAEDIARRILCLPLFNDLSEETVKHIAGLVLQQE